MKLPGLRWHPEVQVPGNVLRAEPKSFMNDRDWSDSGQGGSGQVGYGGNRPMVEQQPGMNMSQGDQGGPRQQRDVPRDGGPRGGGAGPRGPDGPRDGPAGPRGGPGGQRGGDGRSGPRPLMDEPMGGGPNGPDVRGSNQPVRLSVRWNMIGLLYGSLNKQVHDLTGGWSTLLANMTDIWFHLTHSVYTWNMALTMTLKHKILQMNTNSPYLHIYIKFKQIHIWSIHTLKHQKSFL